MFFSKYILVWLRPAVTRHLSLAVALFFLPLNLLSCQGDLHVSPGFPEEGDVVVERVESEEENFRVVQLIDNLRNPWSIDWLPDGRMLITERGGELKLIDAEQIVSLGGLPEIEARSQGGLLDVRVHPDFEQNGWIYFTYSAQVSGGTGTSLARAKLGNGELTDLDVLYTQEPGYSPGRHYGSRIAFPEDGTVLFTIGDRGAEDPSQDLNDPAGSTIRLNEDGSVPDNNPFVGQQNTRPEIYSYGHRNAQGMDIHPETGAIWQHEHGPRGGDELNIIRSGLNYGWPIATYGRTYGTGAPIGVEPHEDPDTENPITHWSPTSIAPSGMTFYTGSQFASWQGNIFLGALAGQHLRRVVLNGESVTHQEVLLDGEIGRIRDVRTGPDGLLYILTDHSSGGLYRVEPVE